MAETTNKEETKVTDAAKDDKKSEAAKKTTEKKVTTTAKKEAKSDDAVKAVEADKITEDNAAAEDISKKSKDAESATVEPRVEAVESISESEIQSKQKSNSSSINAAGAVEQSSINGETVKKTETKFPIAHALTHPVTIYRAPAGSFAGRSFGGVLIITGEDVNGFTPVKLNRSGIGIQTGYVRTVDLQ